MFVEPTTKFGDNRYKPDLVVKHEERILVVDVNVRFGNRDYLQKAAKEKIDKYFPCLNMLQNKYGVNEGTILPVVLGSRGTITPKTTENFKGLGCPKAKQKQI